MNTIDAEHLASSVNSSCVGLTWELHPQVEIARDGRKLRRYRRSDGAGWVCQTDDRRWWPTWAHPDASGRAGWHHHAFGTYTDAKAAFLAFDHVFELEFIAGNSDRMDVSSVFRHENWQERLNAIIASKAAADGAEQP